MQSQAVAVPTPYSEGGSGITRSDNLETEGVDLPHSSSPVQEEWEDSAAPDLAENKPQSLFDQANELAEVAFQATLPTNVVPLHFKATGFLVNHLSGTAFQAFLNILKESGGNYTPPFCNAKELMAVKGSQEEEKRDQWVTDDIADSVGYDKPLTLSIRRSSLQAVKELVLASDTFIS